MKRLRFSTGFIARPVLGAGDLLVLTGLTAVIYGVMRIGFDAPAVIHGPNISLAPSALPWYTFLSLGRMAAAYLLSLVFSVVYGYTAARNRTAQRVLMPLLDILQSVPILSFLPVVLLGASAFLPQGVAAELAAIILIFTSQVWNLTFSFYQSTTTVPKELVEASRVFRLGYWLRFRTLELPFAAIGLIWNSIMSWAGGWFFLMAAEMFRVGSRDFRLPGLGSYLQTAANAGDIRAVLLGVATLVVLIVALDQLIWRPLLAWAERFKVETVGGEEEADSWLLPLLTRSRILAWLGQRLWPPIIGWLDRRDRRLAERSPELRHRSSRRFWVRACVALLGLIVAYGAVRAAVMLTRLPGSTWLALLTGLLATLGRVALALLIALAWTVPVGVAVGTSRKVARVVQPLAQILASVPATALFPVILLALLQLPGGLNLAAVFLMLLGTQWYLLFNVIAGTAAIPQDLRYTARILGLSGWEQWRTLLLPALFPYIITGAITASGGAWNASVVAEYVEFGGHTHATVGLGALIAEATAHGNYALLLAATLSMIFTVVAINRLVWHRLYGLAERRFRME